MQLINQDIFSLTAGIISHPVGYRGITKNELSVKICCKWSIVCEKYHKYIDYWQPGMIQPIQVDEKLWICNLCRQEELSIDCEAVGNAFTKLNRWASEHDLQIYIPYRIGNSKYEWVDYAKVIRSKCPDAAICYPKPSLNQGLHTSYQEIIESLISNKNNISISTVLEILKQKIQALPTRRIRYSSKALFSSYTVSNIQYIYVISLDGLIQTINNFFIVVEDLEEKEKLANLDKAIIELKHEFIEIVAKLPIKKFSDGDHWDRLALGELIVHDCVDLQDVNNVIEQFLN